MRASMKERERKREKEREREKRKKKKKQRVARRPRDRAKDRKRAADYYFSPVHQTNSFLLERGVWRYETRTRCIYSI